METEFLSLYLYKDFWSIPEMNQAKQLIYDIENENKKWILTIMSTDNFIFDNYYYEKEEFLLEDLDVLHDKGIEMIALYETQK